MSQLFWIIFHRTREIENNTFTREVCLCKKWYSKAVWHHPEWSKLKCIFSFYKRTVYFISNIIIYPNILKAEEDLFYSKSNEETKAVTLTKLTSVLSMLLEKLDKAEKDVVQATKELNKARSVISDVQTSGKHLKFHAYIIACVG